MQGGGGGGRGGFKNIINAPEEKPKVTWDLLKRVLQYATPYRWQIVGMLILILLSTGISLSNPLIIAGLDRQDDFKRQHHAPDRLGNHAPGIATDWRCDQHSQPPLERARR